MITYVIMLSQTFPAKHPRHGEPTNFDTQLLNAVWRAHKMSIVFPQYGMKLHTIRSNYDLWSKRFQKIHEGKACISLRVWSGKAYHSKQMEICKLTKADGIGIQRLKFQPDRDGQYVWWNFNIDGRYGKVDDLAMNDGLTLYSWKQWFKNYDLSKPLAIIHFTKFRY